MDITYKVLLYIHIIFGGMALLSGLISMISKKGGRPHKKSGKVFTTSMWIVIASAIIIAIMKNNHFLIMVGIFSFFQNYKGNRAIKNKSLKPNTLDWLVIVLAFLNTVVMIYSMQPVLLVFGGISVFLIISQINTYRKALKHIELPKLQWLKQHIGMMIGTYIATITAFLVQNGNNFLPVKFGVFMWLLPTVILTPLIFYWTKKYTSK